MNTHLQTLEQARDTSADWAITLKPAPGRPELTYAGTEALEAKLWPGDQRSAIALTATWQAAPDSIVVSIPSSAVVALEPGKYRVRVYIDEDKAHAAEFILWLLDSPSADTAAKSYCSGRDVLALLPGISRQINAEEDQADFAEQRGLARDWLDAIILATYDPQGRGDNWDLTDPVWSTWDWTQNNDWLREQVDADAVMVDQEVKRCSAAYAAYLIARFQPIKRDGPDWRSIASDLLAEAENRARNLTVRLDTDGDDEADLRINLGQIRMRRG